MHWKALQGGGGVSQPQGHSANTTCCKGAAREALGAFLKRRICLRNLIWQIPGLRAKVKAFLESNTKGFCVGRWDWCQGWGQSWWAGAGRHCLWFPPQPAPFAASQQDPRGFPASPGSLRPEGQSRGCAADTWCAGVASTWPGRTGASPARWEPHTTQGLCAVTMKTSVPCSSQKWEPDFVNKHSKGSYTEQKLVFFFCEELYLFVLGRGGEGVLTFLNKATWNKSTRGRACALFAATQPSTCLSKRGPLQPQLSPAASRRNRGCSGRTGLGLTLHGPCFSCQCCRKGLSRYQSLSAAPSVCCCCWKRSWLQFKTNSSQLDRHLEGARTRRTGPGLCKHERGRSTQ